MPTRRHVESRTWPSPNSRAHGGGSTWTTYALDPETGLIFIPVGNPGPDFNTSVRAGKNLFTYSVVALDARSGKLRWFRQLNPADDKDWDADVVAAFETSDGRKLLAATGKRGVMHVMNRKNGAMLFSLRARRPVV